ncbi:MAG: TIGR04282 family arsenosugar biosynthesis glycosyltransferase [Nitrospinaceae bacterium]
MQRSPAKAVVMFARDPVPGQVKTRLLQVFNEETVCRIYECFLADTLALLETFAGADRIVAVHPAPQTGFFRDLAGRGFRQIVQEGEDLGDRMRRVFTQLLSAEGRPRVVVIGSDSPTLPREYLAAALESEKDIVLGPSVDGGYYLIGMGPRFVDVFAGVGWGTARVLADTLGRIAAEAASLDLLPPWYDVDLPADLRFLKTHLELLAVAGHKVGTATRAGLRNLEGDSG